MMIQAVLGNPHHPEYGVATIPFPIPHDQYAHCMELLEALEIGDAVKADCQVQEINSFYSVLKRTEMLTVNVEELNYLAKRLDSFDTGEAAQFQAMAHKLELFELKDLINLTFCCQQATVITDFSDLSAVGRDHYMNLHGGSAKTEELDALDGEATARRLIESGSGTITPYGVVYDNGMKLEQVYDGRFFPCYYAMTATEAALYDQKVNGDLRSKMGSLTHKNLPLAIFLEEADLGYPAWSGSTNSKVSNDQIISSLGIGVVRFNGELEPPNVNEFDYEYRVDTDVISSVEVSGGQSDPDNPVTVRFVIQGRTYTVSNVYYPGGDSQLVWVKWHTPSEPCVITIAVSVSGGGTAQNTITCNIVDLDGNDPPNPVADDRNDRFRLVSIPEKEQVTSASWGIWSPWWQENWEWVENWEKCWHTDRWVDDNNVVHRDRWYHWVDNGWWEDHSWWEFDYNSYAASLSASMRITPDSLSPSATATTMKSGYGIQEKVTARVTTTQSAAVTAAQNAVTYFPEFGYEGFWRLLNRSVSGKSTTFAFKNNPYSTYDRPTHFTPIWYPDGSYTPYTWLLDCWTPTGMLSMNLTDSVRIAGDLWEEWHIAPSK